LTVFSNHKLLNKVLLAMLALTILRVISVFFSAYPLQVDEAQYAGWSHDIAAGYYSKPPFIAWILGLGQATCSVLHVDNIEGCTRMLQAPAMLITALFLMATAWQLFASNTIMLLTGALFITLPLVGFYSLVATTDTWLLMWWAIGLFAFVYALKHPELWWPWLLCGVAAGLGILAKYAMLLFILGAAIYLAISGVCKQKQILLKALFAFLIALLVFSPNIFWNINTGFPTFEHHIDISHVETAGNTWTLLHGLSELFSFVSAQFIVFGPWIFLSLLLMSFAKKHLVKMPEQDAPAIKLLLSFVWPMLGLMLFQALMSRAFSNWAVAAYVAGTVLVAAYWGRQIEAQTKTSWLTGKAAVFGSLMVGLVLTTLMIAVPQWTQSSPELRTARANPLRKLMGWKELALWAKSQVQAEPNMRVVAEDRYLLAELSMYGYPETYPALAWNPRHMKDNHYRWFYDLAKADIPAQQEMLLIFVRQLPDTELATLKSSFASVEAIQDATLSAIEIGGQKKHAYAFKVRGFKGYTS
jgi:4-amino-4-deoxy-L-arabinose transferase-like glycosyltransferase